MSALWPHQQRGLEATFRAIESGEKRLCFTSPTGGGKSRCMFEMIDYAQRHDWPVVLYATRNMLIEQLMKSMDDYGIDYGVRASEMWEHENLDARIQIASVPTERSRVFQRKQRNLHHAKLVLWDEAHMQKAATAEKIFQHHGDAGAVNIGLTATPLGISHLYDKLIIAGVNSELRKCGAHLPCKVYAPDEPDLRKVKRSKTGEFQIGEQKYKIWTQTIIGRVVDYYNRLNPERKPTILFAPGVKESMWFVDQLEAAGIRAAHIDGNNVYQDGEEFPSSPDKRQQVVKDLRAGRIDVICNRFVLREGIDIPELYHCILATPIGSLLSYLQTVGRVLRNHSSLDHVVIQDHGGNFWRHGSPNMDRFWQHEWKLSDTVISNTRLERMAEGKEPEPIVCPACGAVRMKGPQCVSCGHQHSKSVRMVVQENGDLKEQTGKILRKKHRENRTDTEKLWTKYYFTAKNSKMTFSQAQGLFKKDQGYYPPKDLPYMPKDDFDWKRKVKDVPVTDLIGRK